MTKKLLLTAALTALALPATAGAANPIKWKPIGPVKVDKIATPAKKTVVTVKPMPLRNLVPSRHVRGDREFGGNGPAVYCRVILNVSADKRAIEAKVHFRATETKSDWSTVDHTFPTTRIWTAPPGKLIEKILGSRISTVKFTSKRAGFQLLVPGEDVSAFMREVDKLALDLVAAHAAMGGGNPRRSQAYRRAERLFLEVQQGKRDMIFRGNHVHEVAPGHGPVSLMSIVGDTGGPDISDDANGKDDTRIESINFNALKVQYKN